MTSLTRPVIMAIALIVLAMLLAVVVPAQCSRIRSQAAQSRVDRAQDTARIESGKDAVETVSRAGEASAASEELSRTNEREIRAADGAGERVKAGVNVAGHAALCRREAYRNDPKCKGTVQ